MLVNSHLLIVSSQRLGLTLVNSRFMHVSSQRLGDLGQHEQGIGLIAAAVSACTHTLLEGIDRAIRQKERKDIQVESK